MTLRTFLKIEDIESSEHSKGEGKPVEELKANKNEAIKELQKGEELKPISEEILDDLYIQTMRQLHHCQLSKSTCR